jgi:plasmid maintenance system antidote protein VapI
MPNLIPPLHSGETILEDILKPLDMSVNRFAKALGITDARLNETVRDPGAGSPPTRRCASTVVRTS